MKISVIVAMANNRVIGLNNQIPWHLSADLKRFKAITMSSPILMGRKTFESIGRPLPGRTNIIISRNPHYTQAGCLIFNDLEKAIDKGCQLAGEIFVIGGSDLYRSVLPRAQALYITEVHKNFAGDTFFPKIDANEWVESGREDIRDDPNVNFEYSFVKLIRSEIR